MDKFDEKVIGYESTKNILRQILDALKRPELYKSKGASIPRGLLMESDPGLGKSLLATVFIKESGRKSLVFRKTSQENSFLDELRAAFLAAKKAAPSIFQMLTMHMRAVIARLSQCSLFTIALLHLVMAIFTTALRHAEILKLQGWNSMIMHILYTTVT